jgi:hypothetical protein
MVMGLAQGPATTNSDQSGIARFRENHTTSVSQPALLEHVRSRKAGQAASSGNCCWKANRLIPTGEVIC